MWKLTIKGYSPRDDCTSFTIHTERPPTDDDVQMVKQRVNRLHRSAIGAMSIERYETIVEPLDDAATVEASYVS
jgi:hypothetical protein